MKLGKLEYASLDKFLGTLVMTQFMLKYRLEVHTLNPDGQNKDLQALSQECLQQLVNVLPSGKVAKVTSPVLKSVRSKVKEALKFVRRPHLDPESWPKVFRRNTKLSNARAGIFEGPSGMLMRLNDQAMAVGLNGVHVWDERNAGELIIMGKWFEISTEIGKSRGLQLKSELNGTAGDVNAEFDKMYGSMRGDAEGGIDGLDEMPFYVSCQGGQQFQCTEKQAEVVADPRNEIVQLVGAKVAFLAGNVNVGGPQWASTARTGLDYVGLTADMIGKARDSLSGGPQKITDHTIYTVVIGTSPAAPKYVSTNTTVLNSDSLLRFTLDALQQA